MSDAAGAFRKIAESKTPFISRGDQSGTHQKELAIWKALGIKPEGKWYVEAGQGMGPVLTMANEKLAYTLSDRGTYLKYAGDRKIGLKLLSEGGKDLLNPYGVIAVNPANCPNAKYVYAMAYIGWVTSQEGQKIIKEFGVNKFGQPLFIPTAIPQAGGK
jgi:tungstate transport system substrate-binding protein